MANRCSIRWRWTNRNEFGWLVSWTDGKIHDRGWTKTICWYWMPEYETCVSLQKEQEQRNLSFTSICCDSKQSIDVFKVKLRTMLFFIHFIVFPTHLVLFWGFAWDFWYCIQRVKFYSTPKWLRAEEMLFWWSENCSLAINLTEI